MTIKEIMLIGTEGLSDEQMEAEKVRRISVAERLNRIWMLSRSEDKQKVNRYKRELRKIKASESEWLRNAAWFLY